MLSQYRLKITQAGRPGISEQAQMCDLTNPKRRVFPLSAPHGLEAGR
jgi:hypothetical protein